MDLQEILEINKSVRNKDTLTNGINGQTDFYTLLILKALTVMAFTIHNMFLFHFNFCKIQWILCNRYGVEIELVTNPV